MRYAALPDIWKPAFPLGYALSVVVLERAAHSEARGWLAAVTLAGLVGFTGLLALTLGPVLLILWAGLEAVALVQSRYTGTTAMGAARIIMSTGGSTLKGETLRSGAGLALAIFLLVLVSGRAASFLDGLMASGLSLRWNPDSGLHLPHESFDLRPGGVGLLAAGPLAVAGAAALLSWRDRLVLALVAGAGVLVLAWLVLHYYPAPGDLNRLAGHARTFALVALLLALSGRLAALSPRAGHAAGALLVGLVVWPTVVAPVRYAGLAIGQGITIANAQPPQGPRARFGGRYSLDPRPSDRVAAYIREHTAIDARVFSPHANRMTFATGRPNAAGFVGLLHYISFNGPDYLDALRYLEPAAIRRLGIHFVHAPDAWVDGLPDQAVQRLNDPRLFELLVRDDAEALYRVRPALLNLDYDPSSGVVRGAAPSRFPRPPRCTCRQGCRAWGESVRRGR